MSYALPGAVKRRWNPALPLPYDLFDYVRNGGVLKIHNVMFEWAIWHEICVPKYGFPELTPFQVRCTMATARVNSYPGGLDKLSEVLDLPIPKDKEGKRLLGKFSVPRNPTKKDPRKRILPQEDPEEFERLC
jgi:DNA polymerase